MFLVSQLPKKGYLLGNEEVQKEGQGTRPALHLLVVCQKVLAQPYAGIGKGLKPDIDTAESLRARGARLRAS